MIAVLGLPWGQFLRLTVPGLRTPTEIWKADCALCEYSTSDHPTLADTMRHLTRHYEAQHPSQMDPDAAVAAMQEAAR